MSTDRKIIIDGVEYNPCNGCILWNGHHCIGARSYEPNADEHKAICNEHIANQFHKIYQQLYRKAQEYELLVRTNKIHIDTLDQLNNKYIDLEQECEELKNKIRGLQNDR